MTQQTLNQVQLTAFDNAYWSELGGLGDRKFAQDFLRAQPRKVAPLNDSQDIEIIELFNRAEEIFFNRDNLKETCDPLAIAGELYAQCAKGNTVITYLTAIRISQIRALTTEIESVMVQRLAANKANLVNAIKDLNPPLPAVVILSLLSENNFQPKEKKTLLQVLWNHRTHYDPAELYVVLTTILNSNLLVGSSLQSFIDDVRSLEPSLPDSTKLLNDFLNHPEQKGLAAIQRNDIEATHCTNALEKANRTLDEVIVDLAQQWHKAKLDGESSEALDYMDKFRDLSTDTTLNSDDTIEVIKHKLEIFNTRITSLLAARWEDIKDFHNSYVTNPNLPLNQQCLRLAQVVDPERVNQLLMPTVKEAIDGRNINFNELKLGQFILSDDKTRFIDLRTLIGDVQIRVNKAEKEKPLFSYLPREQDFFGYKFEQGMVNDADMQPRTLYIVGNENGLSITFKVIDPFGIIQQRTFTFDFKDQYGYPMELTPALCEKIINKTNALFCTQPDYTLTPSERNAFFTLIPYYSENFYKIAHQQLNNNQTTALGAIQALKIGLINGGTSRLGQEFDAAAPAMEALTVFLDWAEKIKESHPREHEELFKLGKGQSYPEGRLNFILDDLKRTIASGTTNDKAEKDLQEHAYYCVNTVNSSLDVFIAKYEPKLSALTFGRGDIYTQTQWVDVCREIEKRIDQPDQEYQPSTEFDLIFLNRTLIIDSAEISQLKESVFEYHYGLFTNDKIRRIEQSRRLDRDLHKPTYILGPNYLCYTAEMANPITEDHIVTRDNTIVSELWQKLTGSASPTSLGCHPLTANYRQIITATTGHVPPQSCLPPKNDIRQEGILKSFFELARFINNEIKGIQKKIKKMEKKIREARQHQESICISNIPAEKALMVKYKNIIHLFNEGLLASNRTEAELLRTLFNVSSELVSLLKSSAGANANRKYQDLILSNFTGINSPHILTIMAAAQSFLTIAQLKVAMTECVHQKNYDLFENFAHYICRNYSQLIDVDKQLDTLLEAGEYEFAYKLSQVLSKTTLSQNNFSKFWATMDIVSSKSFGEHFYTVDHDNSQKENPEEILTKTIAVRKSDLRPNNEELFKLADALFFNRLILAPKSPDVLQIAQGFYEIVADENSTLGQLASIRLMQISALTRPLSVQAAADLEKQKTKLVEKLLDNPRTKPAILCSLIEDNTLTEIQRYVIANHLWANRHDNQSFMSQIIYILMKHKFPGEGIWNFINDVQAYASSAPDVDFSHSLKNYREEPFQKAIEFYEEKNVTAALLWAEFAVDQADNMSKTKIRNILPTILLLSLEEISLSLPADTALQSLRLFVIVSCDSHDVNLPLVDRLFSLINRNLLTEAQKSQLIELEIQQERKKFLRFREQMTSSIKNLAATWYQHNLMQHDKDSSEALEMMIKLQFISSDLAMSDNEPIEKVGTKIDTVKLKISDFLNSYQRNSNILIKDCCTSLAELINANVIKPPQMVENVVTQPPSKKDHTHYEIKQEDELKCCFRLMRFMDSIITRQDAFFTDKFGQISKSMNDLIFKYHQKPKSEFKQELFGIIVGLSILVGVYSTIREASHATHHYYNTIMLEDGFYPGHVQTVINHPKINFDDKSAEDRLEKSRKLGDNQLIFSDNTLKALIISDTCLEKKTETIFIDLENAAIPFYFLNNDQKVYFKDLDSLLKEAALKAVIAGPDRGLRMDMLNEAIKDSRNAKELTQSLSALKEQIVTEIFSNIKKGVSLHDISIGPIGQTIERVSKMVANLHIAETDQEKIDCIRACRETLMPTSAGKIFGKVLLAVFITAALTTVGFLAGCGIGMAAGLVTGPGAVVTAILTGAKGAAAAYALSATATALAASALNTWGLFKHNKLEYFIDKCLNDAQNAAGVRVSP